MSDFTFDIPVVSPYESARQEAFALAGALREQKRTIEKQAERIRLHPQSLISLRLPTDLLVQLDEVAEQTDLCRSSLLRLIASDYIAHVKAEGIQYRGCLSVFSTRESRRQRYD